MFSAPIFLRRRTVYGLIGAAVLILSALPLTGANPYALHIWSTIGVYAIAAMGLNLVFGYTGQISLGHAAYFAVGAYTSALLTTDLGVPFALSIAAAILLSTLLGLVVGIPSLKLDGAYLGMATIGFGEMVKMTLVNWEALTHGPTGISRIPLPEFLGYRFATPQARFYLVLALTALAFFVYCNLVRSHYGMRFVAVRDSPKAAAAMGVHVQRTKVYAFAFSTAFVGLAGGLYAHLNRYIAPDAFTLGESINFVVIVVLGGMGTLVGPIVGSFVVVYLRETLQALQDANMLLYGLLLMILMIVMPRGLVGAIGIVYRRWTRRRVMPPC